MSQLLLSVSANAFSKQLKESLDRIANLVGGLGVTGVQLDYINDILPLKLSETGSRHLLNLLKERQFKLSNVLIPLKRSLYDPEYLDARIDVIKQAFKFAAMGKAPTITFRAGRIPPESDNDTYESLCKTLEEISSRSLHYGVTPCLQLYTESVDEVQKLMSTLGKSGLKIVFDPASCVQAGQEALDYYQTLHKHVGYVSARDITEDEFGNYREVALGQGNVRWNLLVPILSQQPEAVWINIQRTTGTNQQKEIISAVQQVIAYKNTF